jgi:hypothetical protein
VLSGVDSDGVDYPGRVQTGWKIGGVDYQALGYSEPRARNQPHSPPRKTREAFKVKPKKRWNLIWRQSAASQLSEQIVCAHPISTLGAGHGFARRASGWTARVCPPPRASAESEHNASATQAAPARSAAAQPFILPANFYNELEGLGTEHCALGEVILRRDVSSRGDVLSVTRVTIYRDPWAEVLA